MCSSAREQFYLKFTRDRNDAVRDELFDGIRGRHR